MRVLRSLLFVPGNRPNMLDKALGLSPDAYVPDMEDSVPDEEKGAARNTIASYLPKLSSVGPVVIPRVNSLDSGLMEDDLAAVVRPDITGVSVGKISSANDIQLVSDAIGRAEKRAGIRVGQVKLIPWIETAKAIVNAHQICSSSARIVGVAFGAEDFTNDMAIERTGDEAEVWYPRAVVGVAARAAGVLALDTPFFGLRDGEGLQRDALTAKKYGFRGKFAIHPSQIDVINEAFSPSAAEIENARRVVASFEEAELAGRASTSLDGKVIDVPVVRRARSLLEVAESLTTDG